jgi:hypothetical protein
VDDTLDELKDANFYTHLDLAYGLWRVRVRDHDIHKKVFQTPDGLMEWVAMPFGLGNSPATFQRMMNDILRDFLRKFVTVYLDDVCTYNRILEEHMEHMRLVLQRFKEEGLKLRLKKCYFMKWNIWAMLCLLVKFRFQQESRRRCRHASAYDAEGGSQFRAILQLICHINSSFQ